MPVYIITCPICRKQFKLTPKNPSTLTIKTFSCPNCRYTTPFSTLIKELSTSQHTTRSEEASPASMNSQLHSATKVSQNIALQSKVYITVIGSNTRFVLNQGVYVLGRKSSDSTATLQLAPDISMSRQHARLAVQMVGGRLMAQIVGLKANNPIFINGKVYTAGQPCTLKDGDKLQLGVTRLIFSI